MNFKILSLSVFSIMLVSFSVKAQDIEENIRMVKSFKADGVSNEWNEPLNEYNDATKLAFALANDDKNLYIIIESLDPQTTFSVLRGGITLNINTAGKKKDGIKLTFPLIERPPMPKEGDGQREHALLSPGKDNDLHDPAVMNKSIRVSGFKNIADGELPAMNRDGIETGMSIHPNRDLIYELSIPLMQLQVGLDLKKPLVYNIKINEPNKSGFKREARLQGAGDGKGRSGGRGGMGGGGRGGMGGGGRMGGGGQRPSEGGESAAKSSDFWIKYKLVKA
ncbi:putative membrane protein YgcG [Flavobacterium sp. W4I14]|nr:putative membrane protein YgcG [Flavobacterium sp. W4I14]